MVNFVGTTAGETFNGTEFNDTAIGNGGKDKLNGNGGDDTLRISGISTSLAAGGSGDDTLIAVGSGSKTLSGGEGDDHLYVAGTATAYALHGGDGFDTLSLYETTTINLSGASITGIESFIGTESDDTTTLGFSAFTTLGAFDGGGGTDTLNLKFGGDRDIADITEGAWFDLENVEILNVVGSDGNDHIRMKAEQFARVDMFSLSTGSDVLHVETAGDVDFTVRFPTLSGVQSLILTGTGSVRMTVAQHAAFTSIASDIFVTVTGTGAELAALTSEQLSKLSAKGVDQLDATDGVLTLSKVQALALGAMTLAASDTVVVTGNELANLTPTQINNLWTKGVDRFDAKNDSLVLTAAKYSALHGIALTGSDVVTLRDTGANIAALGIETFQTLVPNGVDKIDASDNLLNLRAAQIAAVAGGVLTAADTVTLADTGANIGAITASDIAALAGKGVDRVNATDDVLTLTVAQYRALGAVALTQADHVILADTSANLATLTPAENAALAGKGIDQVLTAPPTTIETAMASYTLDSFANNLRFIGTGPFSGTGNALDNVITGGDSNDTLRGLDGNDTLVGGNGDDLLIGGPGSDILSGGSGIGDYASYINATTGVTVSLANASANSGEAAGDTYSGIERLEGSSFNDTLIGDAGNNTLRGGAGADVLNGGLGSDYASYTTATTGLRASLANPGDNTGDAAGDTYISIESLAGSSFDDVLLGDGFDNTFQGGLGADFISGGAGFDYASYFNAAMGVTASLANPANNTGEAAGDTYALIEGLTGSAFADSLVGNGVDNWLLGGGGADQLNGGNGFDYASYGNSTIGLTVSLLDPAANTGEGAGDAYTSIEGLSGSSFNDILIGNADNNALSGGVGNDSLSGGDGNDQLFGGSGDDFLEGGAGVDMFSGGDGTDTVSYYQYSVSGGTGVTASLENASINTGDAAGETYVSIENLAGTFWNDTLIGTGGNNVIDGVNGADVFNGRGGMDTLTGNGGGDTYIFDSAIGAGNLATIVGFAHGQDHFNLDNAIFTQLGAEGALGAGAFVNGTAALDADDRIIFNGATGAVSYDADGSGAGAAVVFATMQNLGVALDHTDFLIV